MNTYTAPCKSSGYDACYQEAMIKCREIVSCVTYCDADSDSDDSNNRPTANNSGGSAVEIAALNCADPMNPNVEIPNGSHATREQMLNASVAVKAYGAAVNTYGACVKQALTDLASAGKLSAETKRVYTESYNHRVDELDEVAARFNAELKSYKAKESQ